MDFIFLISIFQINGHSLQITEDIGLISKTLLIRVILLIIMQERLIYNNLQRVIINIILNY